MFVTLRFLLMSAALSSYLCAAPALVTSPSARVLVNGGAMMDGNVFKAATLPAMRAFYPATGHVALILHASHPEDRDRMEARLQAAFRDVAAGLTAESVHQHDEAGALALLRRADAVFIGGGDTFMLLRVLRETGQLDVLRERILAGVPVGGSSAGANVLGLVIGGTNDFPVTDVPTRESIAAFPAVINPHHPLATAADFGGREWKIRNYLRWNPAEVILGLGDAATAVLRDGQVTLELGPAWLYVPGKETRWLETGDRIPELDPAD
jgi:dipeptidase E